MMMRCRAAHSRPASRSRRQLGAARLVANSALEGPLPAVRYALAAVDTGVVLPYPGARRILGFVATRPLIVTSSQNLRARKGSDTKASWPLAL